MRLLDDYRRGSLCVRTTLTITLVSTVFLLFTLTVLSISVIIPTAERSAEDMVSLVLLGTESLNSVAVKNRTHYMEHMFDSFELDLSPPPHDLYPRKRHLPFFLLLEAVFKKHLGHNVTILQTDTPGRENHYWVKLDNDGTPLYVGFEYSQKWVDPPLIILLIIIVGLFATFFTGMTLARRLTKPLKLLSDSTQQLGRGENIKPLIESGPLELKELVCSINRMSQQIQELLENRTTLLAGISHDLRTPLTRMELSVEMLEHGDDPSLIQQLRRDIGQMNNLIRLFLEISRGLQKGGREKIDVREMLKEISEEFQGSGINLTYHNGPSCVAMIYPLALRRIIINLIENATRYSSGNEVIMQYTLKKEGKEDNLTIEILDRGPGIPEHKKKAVFRPFYRLDHSRNSSTGGSGLGLTIVKQLAEANGYQIDLTNREGGGTSARIVVNNVV